MLYLIKVILSSFLPFMKEAMMGANGHPFMDGKKRKSEGGLVTALLPIALLCIAFVSTDLLEKYDMLNKLTLTVESTKKELSKKEKKLEELEVKYETLGTENAKLDTALFRKNFDYKDLNVKYIEMKDLYKTLFTKYETLKESKEGICFPNVDYSNETIDLDELNRKLNEYNRGNND